MAEGIQKGFQYVLIVLGIIVVALAVWMAKEHMLWIAVPDACFGIGVAWFAWTEIADHGMHPAPATAGGPALSEMPPPPVAAGEPHAEARPEATTPTALPAAPPMGLPGRKKKKKRRH